MPSCNVPPEFIGVDQATLQLWLSQCQQALQDLTVGGKAESAAYTQGDGSKSITFTRADISQLDQRIRNLARALGLTSSRRAIAISF